MHQQTTAVHSPTRWMPACPCLEFRRLLTRHSWRPYTRHTPHACTLSTLRLTPSYTAPAPPRFNPLQKTGLTLEELYHEKPAPAIAADYAAWMQTYEQQQQEQMEASAAAASGEAGGAGQRRPRAPPMEEGPESGPERRAENGYIAHAIRSGKSYGALFHYSSITNTTTSSSFTITTISSHSFLPMTAGEVEALFYALVRKRTRLAKAHPEALEVGADRGCGCVCHPFDLG